MTEVIFTLIGALFGFFLSELSTIIRERREKRELSQSIQILLKLEMNLNLQMLQVFWTKVNCLPESQEAPEDSDDKKRALARQLVEESGLQFDRRVLDSQLPYLGKAFKEPKALQVLQFYDRLSKLESIMKEVIACMDEQKQEMNLATAEGDGGFARRLNYLPPRPFDEKAPRLWDKCEELVNRILAEQNPFVIRSEGI